MPIYWKSDDSDVYAEPYKLSGTMTEYGGSKLFVAWVADCFQPPMILVLGDSFEDAFENACLHPIISRSARIEDCDLGDYDPENLQYDADGWAIDTEALQMVEVA